MKNKDLEYKKMYGVYKKLPVIVFFATLVSSFIWGACDWIVGITDMSELYFGCLLIWMIIGTVAGTINMYVAGILLSPTIIRTDATVAILDAVKGGAHANTAFDSFADELPEL